MTIVGTQGNAWNNASTGAAGLSAAIDLVDTSSCQVFGNTSGASTITIQWSADGVNFYNDATTVAASGDFSTVLFPAARWIRLKSSANVTATISIMGK